MAANTAIEWADHTFNPWWGCTRVSPACDHCYAEALARRTGAGHLWQGERRRTSILNWNMPRRWNRQAAASGTRPRVFCASMADVFDNQVPAEWREDLWRLITATPHLDWLLLTKRPQNIRKMLPDDCGWLDDGEWGWPWPNVWLGTTVENQQEADRRIPHLLAVPAAVRFLSCEPLLGPVDLTCLRRDEVWRWNALTGQRWVPSRADRRTGCTSNGHPSIDWLIAGGESGPKARPSHPDWFRSLRDQCAAAGVPFFFKQWGEWAAHLPAEAWTRDSHRWPIMPREPQGGVWSYRIGKRAAGRLLDGIEHNAFPTSPALLPSPSGRGLGEGHSA